MDDIWDEPAVVQASAPRTHEPLFTFSDDEDAGQQAPRLTQRRPAAKPKNADDLDDIVADLFDDLIDPNDIQSSADIDAALARTGNAPKSASSAANKIQQPSHAKGGASAQPDGEQDGQTKPKRTIAKVDEQRLLSERGIPALIKEAKKFKPRGKGHEVEDLDRLMSIYQFWAHNMFPKTQFQDTIDRVERVCRSRRMLINMSMWRDAETTGRIPERDPNKSDSSEEENEDNIVATATTVSLDRTAQTSDVSTSIQVTATSVPATIDEDVDLWDDVDDALAEMQATNQRQPVAPLGKPPIQASYADDDELEEWFNADSEPILSQKKQTELQGDSMDIDDMGEAPTSTNPQRMLSPPRADNWDEDLFS